MHMKTFQQMYLNDPPNWQAKQFIKLIQNDQMSSLEFQEDHNSAENDFGAIYDGAH